MWYNRDGTWIGPVLRRAATAVWVGMLVAAISQEVQAQCTADECSEGWTTVCWTGQSDPPSNDWQDMDNWSGLYGDDKYPGDNGNDEYCVVIEDDSELDTVELDDEHIQIKTLQIGADMTVKILTGAHLEMNSYQGPDTEPDSMVCDGELWISSGCSGCLAEEEYPGEVTLDGRWGMTDGEPDDSKACVLNGMIKFYQAPGASPAAPGVLQNTKCTRLISEEGYNGSIVGSHLGLIKLCLDTFTIGEEITISGAMEIGAYIPDWLSSYMGTIDADTANDTITLNGNPKQAMGTYKASGGTLKVDREVTGVGTWDLDSGTIQFTSNGASTGLTGEFKVSGGTFDADENVQTTDKCTIDGSCTIDVASGKTVTVKGVDIGHASNSVSVTRSGAGDFETT